MTKKIKICRMILDHDPRHKRRLVTDRGLTLYQLNSFLRGTGYRVQRGFSLVPVNKNFKRLPDPSFDTFLLRQYDSTLSWWEREINKKLKHGGKNGNSSTTAEGCNEAEEKA